MERGMSVTDLLGVQAIEGVVISTPDNCDEE
jgi:hypothetical protein